MIVFQLLRYMVRKTSVSQADVETIMAEAQTFVERIKEYLSLS
jgi:hypothetical protein